MPDRDPALPAQGFANFASAGIRASEISTALAPQLEAARRLAEVFGPTSELQRRFAAITQPMADFNQQIAQVLAPITDMQKRLAEAVAPWADLANRATTAFEPFLKIGREIAAHAARHRQLAAAGWLPHASTPWAALEGFETSEEVTAAMLAHYRVNWPEIGRAAVEHVRAQGLNLDAERAMKTAVDMHASGHFRAIAPMLFADIERVTRAELDPTRMAVLTLARMDEARISKLYPADFDLGGWEAVTLFETVFSHAYNYINTEAERQVFADDPIPNRHAAIHGLVVYDGEQSSLNMIFLADYCFRLIRLMKDEDAL
jgi:hypothetical protein